MDPGFGWRIELNRILLHFAAKWAKLTATDLDMVLII